MKGTHKLTPVLVVASTATYVALTCCLDGATEGFIVGLFMGGTMGEGVHEEILGATVRLAVIMIVLTLAAGSLTVNLLGPGSERGRMVYLWVVSVFCLIGLNLMLWEQIVVVVMDLMRNSDGSRLCGTLFLTLALAVLLMSSNISMILGLVNPTQCEPRPSDLELAVPMGGRGNWVGSTSKTVEPSTPPYIPNLFANQQQTRMSECDICSMDFNSWRTQKQISLDDDDSMDDCYETVLEGRAEEPENSVKRIQMVRSAPLKDILAQDEDQLNTTSVVEENKNTCNIALERSMYDLFHILKPGSLWSRVCEENEKFEYPIWMKASAIVCSVLLVHTCITSIYSFRNLASDWRLAVNTIEVLGSKEDVHRHPQVGSHKTNGVHIHEVSESLNYDNVHKIKDGKEFEILNHNEYVVYHENMEKAKGFIVVNSRMLVKALLYVGSVADRYRNTVIIGYIFSTLVAFWGLFMVFANYKNLVINLDTMQSAACEGKTCVQKYWDRSNPTYSTAGAVYFLGTLTSTTIIQQHLLGVFVSSILAIAANVSNLGNLINLLGYRPIIMLGLLLVATPVSRFLGNHHLSDGLHVHYPVWFFLFMFFFSIGNFVWGIYLGLYRLSVLFVSTLLAVNRLDLAKYQTGLGLDNGHNTFMSTALLSDRIQEMTLEPQQNKVSRENTELRRH